MFGKVVELLKRFAVLGSANFDAPPVKLCPNCKTIMRPPRCALCRYEEAQYNPITLDVYFMGRYADPEYRAEMTPQLRENARELLKRVNSLLAELLPSIPWLVRVKVNSGWRPARINAQIGGSKQSKHIICKAIDISDIGQSLSKYLAGNPGLLEKYDLAIEHPDATPTWCHIQFGAPPSGNRVFKP